MYWRKSSRRSPLVKTWGVFLWGLVLLSVVAVPVVLAGCGSDSTTETEGPKILVVGCDGVPYTTFHALQEGAYYAIEDNVYERLCTWDQQTGKTVPQIAESWDVSADAKTWTWHIRQGTKFHDGADLDANAVKLSLEMSKEIGLQSVTTDAIASMSVPDKYTLVMKLKYPQRMDMGSTALCCMSIVDVAGAEKYGDKAFTPGYDLGSGPYKLTSATTSELKFERYKEYYGGWQGEKAKCPDIAVFRGIDEPAARIQNLEQGAVQVAFGILPEDAQRLKGNEDFNVFSNHVWNILTYVLNTQKAPLNDANVREALYWSYPYDDVLQLAIGGEGAVVGGPTAVGAPGYEAQVQEFGIPKQDMDKARAALARSEYPEGNITLDCPVEMGKAWEMKATQLWKTALADLNIKLNAHLQNTMVTLERAWSENPPQHILVGAWMKTTSLPYELHYTQLTPINPAWNLCYWSDPKCTKLIMEGVSAFAKDEAAGVSKLNEGWGVARAANPVLYTVDVKALSASTKTIGNFNGSEPGGQNSLSCYNISME